MIRMLQINWKKNLMDKTVEKWTQKWDLGNKYMTRATGN